MENDQKQGVFDSSFLKKLEDPDFREWCRVQSAKIDRRTRAVLKGDFTTPNNDEEGQSDV